MVSGLAVRATVSPLNYLNLSTLYRSKSDLINFVYFKVYFVTSIRTIIFKAAGGSAAGAAVVYFYLNISTLSIYDHDNFQAVNVTLMKFTHTVVPSGSVVRVVVNHFYSNPSTLCRSRTDFMTLIFYIYSNHSAHVN